MTAFKRVRKRILGAFSCSFGDRYSFGVLGTKGLGDPNSQFLVLGWVLYYRGVLHVEIRFFSGCPSQS